MIRAEIGTARSDGILQSALQLVARFTHAVGGAKETRVTKAAILQGHVVAQFSCATRHYHILCANDWSKAASSTFSPGPLFVGPAKGDRVSPSLFVRFADVFPGIPSDRLKNLLGPVDRFLVGHCGDRVVPTVKLAAGSNYSKDFNNLDVCEVLAQLNKVLGPRCIGRGACSKGQTKRGALRI